MHFREQQRVQKEKKVDKYISEGIVFLGYDHKDFKISNKKGRILGRKYN